MMQDGIADSLDIGLLCLLECPLVEITLRGNRLQLLSSCPLKRTADLRVKKALRDDE